jgi:hypothetical protein
MNVEQKDTRKQNVLYSKTNKGTGRNSLVAVKKEIPPIVHGETKGIDPVSLRKGSQVGSLAECVEHWREIGCPSWILDGISQGFKIKTPNKFEKKWGSNRIVKMEEVKWWEEELKRCLEKNILMEWDKEVRAISSVHLVPKKGLKKFRAVINLKGVNKGLMVKKTKFEHLQFVIPYIQKGDWMITFDIKEGYHHVKIHPESWDLLAIEWKGKKYVNTVLPFGLAESPYIFTKVVKVMVKYLREKGLRVFFYIDDFLVLNQSKEGLLKDRLLVEETLQKLGWLRAEDKGCWNPTMCVEYLGLLIDTEFGNIKVTEEKLKKMIGISKTLLSSSLSKRRAISSLAGMMISIQLAFLPARFMARAMYDNIGMTKIGMKGSWWNKRVPISQSTKENLIWFINQASKWNGRSFLVPELTTVINLETDSSSLMYGAVLEDQILQGAWEKEKIQNHIGVKELETILISLKNFGPSIQNKKLQIRTDNMTALSYVLRAGGKKENLNMLAREIWKIVLEKNITLLKPYWIPSKENCFSDGLSRGLQAAEWSLNQKVFDLIEKKFGKMEIDRFASE